MEVVAGKEGKKQKDLATRTIQTDVETGSRVPLDSTRAAEMSPCNVIRPPYLIRWC